MSLKLIVRRSGDACSEIDTVFVRLGASLFEHRRSGVRMPYAGRPSQEDVTGIVAQLDSVFRMIQRAGEAGAAKSTLA